jgi:hypothetical protein
MSRDLHFFGLHLVSVTFDYLRVRVRRTDLAMQTKKNINNNRRGAIPDGVLRSF